MEKDNTPKGTVEDIYNILFPFTITLIKTTKLMSDNLQIIEHIMNQDGRYKVVDGKVIDTANE